MRDEIWETNSHLAWFLRLKLASAQTPPQKHLKILRNEIWETGIHFAWFGDSNYNLQSTQTRLQNHLKRLAKDSYAKLDTERSSITSWAKTQGFPDNYMTSHTQETCRLFGGCQK